MAYKVKYFMEFDTIISLARVRVEFHKKDYKLSRVHRLLGVGDSPLMINYQGDDTLRSAEITIQFVVQNRKLEGLKNFWTATEKDWKILIYVNDSIFLESFLLVTDHSTEPMTDDNYILTLKATDGLSLLDSIYYKTSTFKTETYETWDFNRGGTIGKTVTQNLEIVNDYLNDFQNVSELLCRSFGLSELCEKLVEFVNIYDENMVTTQSALSQVSIHLERLREDKDRFVHVRKILQVIADTFGAFIFQKNGKWFFTSLSELSKSVQKGREFSLIGAFQSNFTQNSNDYLDHASKLSRFYFINANAIRWYVAPLRKIVAKLDYKDNLNVLKNSNFVYYNEAQNLFESWNKVGNLIYSRAVVDGYSNVVRINQNRSVAGTGFIRSVPVILPAHHGVRLIIRLKRDPFKDSQRNGTVNTNNLNVKVEIKNNNKNYILYGLNADGQLDFGKNVLLGEPEFKQNVLRRVVSKVGLVDIDLPPYKAFGSFPNSDAFNNQGFFELYTPYQNGFPQIINTEFVEFEMDLENVSVLGLLDSELSISFRCPLVNSSVDISSIEVRFINQNQQNTGEFVELTNDEQSKVETKNIDLTYNDDVYEYQSHALFNNYANKNTVSWRRLGREEGKSLGELTAELTFNNLINHRPYFQTDFKTRTAPYNYGDTFTYKGMKYLPQDYEYNVKMDEIKARIIRPIGDCDYNHKAEFWDVLKDGGEILTLTKRYVIDSSACADLTDPIVLGQFFEFKGLAVDDNLWKEAEGSGSNIVQVPFGEFFNFGGLVVEENQWRESEGNGTELSVPNFGQFIEFGLATNENLWREAQGAGSELTYDTPYGQFFEFELGNDITLWNEAENLGRPADFNEEFSDDFDSIE